jgi:hypothetical protein
MHQTGLTKTTFRRISGGLMKATISIVQDWHRGDPYHIYRLVPHETMHALGFNGHVRGFDSVLTVSGGRNSFSEWDLLFLRVLYDPRLPAGTPRVFALPLACRLMHERLIAERNRDVTDLNPAGSHALCGDLARAPSKRRYQPTSSV